MCFPFAAQDCIMRKMKLDKRQKQWYTDGYSMREVKLVTRYILYNNDVQVAEFSVHSSVITEFTPQRPELLPKQICHATADGFASWLRERAVDLNSVKHIAREIAGVQRQRDYQFAQGFSHKVSL